MRQNVFPLQKDSILSRLKPSPPHLGLASKETYKVNGASKNTVLSSSSTTRKISSSYPLESSRGHVNSSPGHPNLNNSTNLTVAAVKRNAKRRGPANRHVGKYRLTDKKYIKHCVGDPCRKRSTFPWRKHLIFLWKSWEMIHCYFWERIFLFE